MHTEPPSFRTATDRNGQALEFLRLAVGLLFLLFGEYKVSARSLRCAAGFSFGSTAFWRVARTHLWRRGCAASYCRMPRLSHFWWPTGSSQLDSVCCLAFSCERPVSAGLFLCSRCCFLRTIPGRTLPFGSISAPL